MTRQELDSLSRKAAQQIDDKVRGDITNIPAVHWYEEIISSTMRPLTEKSEVWRKQLVGLTPGGSEFVDDPKRCADFVKDRRDSQHKLLIESAKELKAVRPLVEELDDEKLAFQHAEEVYKCSEEDNLKLVERLEKAEKLLREFINADFRMEERPFDERVRAFLEGKNV